MWFFEMVCELFVFIFSASGEEGRDRRPYIWVCVSIVVLMLIVFLVWLFVTPPG